MMSIIVCSISSERLEALRRNVQQTIGVDFEIIAVDNREKHWPIAKVYNYAAQRAKYPNLFFAHEDVRLHSNGWGTFVLQKMAEPDCGVIGFAGSKIRLACYAGWCQSSECVVSYLYQGLGNGETEFCVVNVYLERPFEEVVVVDGLGMFVRKDVWEKYPFDEKLLTGFHCYDLDFTLQIASAHFKNYVCCSNNVLIEHFSLGTFNGEWFSGTIRMQKKWNHLLPIKTSDVKMGVKRRAQCEEDFSYDFLKKIIKSNCIDADKRLVLKEFWLRPLSWKHFRRCLSWSVKYLRSRVTR